MFDIGGMELLVVAVLALVVVGPKDLPRLLRTVGGIVRKVRGMAAEFKAGVETLAAEAEREIDPFADLRKKEGLRPGMSPEEVTNHIMANREREVQAEKKADDTEASETAAAKADTPKPDAGGAAS